MSELIYDLAIAGAGCAGLSLAMRLAERAPHLKVALLDSRTDYENDRTWCFWTSGSTSSEQLIEKRWPRWRFSDDKGRAHSHTGQTHHYACVRAGRFYEHALQKINAAKFSLHLDAPVSAMRATESGIAITAGDTQLRAAQVVDTRPPAHTEAKLYQVFAGFEVETSIDAFDPDEAGLMETMTADAHGFRFLYTLPFSTRHALIELTRFAPTPIPPTSLDAELALATKNLGEFRILRREYGLLPMGQEAAPVSSDRRIVRAGTAAGAIRAATGYAFLRIQNWAEACATPIAFGGPALPHPPEPAFRSWLDAVFLTALRSRPENGPAYFMKIAKALSPDGFARFMTDAARTSDLARLVTALPPVPLWQRLRFLVGEIEP